jgi:hypothetical protein
MVSGQGDGQVAPRSGITNPSWVRIRHFPPSNFGGGLGGWSVFLQLTVLASVGSDNSLWSIQKIILVSYTQMLRLDDPNEDALWALQVLLAGILSVAVSAKLLRE